MNKPDNRPKDKDLNLDRIVFFSDAVVAITITLLVLDLKLDAPLSRPIQWADIAVLLPKFAAFLLSFVLIASFWLIHNNFWYIKRVNETLVWLNISWLFFIAILPFSASLLSAHFGEGVATMFYALNTLGITACQNFIWDYACVKPEEYLDDEIPPQQIRNYRIYFNVGLVNGLIAVGFAFFAPKLAFFVLFTRPLMMDFYMRLKLRRRFSR